MVLIVLVGFMGPMMMIDGFAGTDVIDGTDDIDDADRLGQWDR